MIRFTEEQKQFLINNNYMKSLEELTELFNKKFNTNIPKINIKYFRTNHKLSSGLTGRFEKGRKTWNKGKKWNEYMSKESQKNCRKTTFKKGNIPVNHKEVGSERINIDGYIEVKVEEPNIWKYKHRIIYEQYYGKIPKGCNIIFLDGNKQNLNINNLKAVSKAEDLIMNRNKFFTSDKDITNVGSIIAKVIDKGNKLRNERNKK